jgi:hypothetical protein
MTAERDSRRLHGGDVTDTNPLIVCAGPSYSRVSNPSIRQCLNCVRNLESRWGTNHNCTDIKGLDSFRDLRNFAFFRNPKRNWPSSQNLACSPSWIRLIWP